MYKFIFTFLFTSITWSASAELPDYEFEDWAGTSLPTFVAKPNKINAETRLVVVMHGRKRNAEEYRDCLLYTSPSPRDRQKSRMPSSA